MYFDPVACGKRIKELRIYRNLTQEQFAEHLHIFRNHVSKLENGVTTGSIELLVDIATYFEVSMDYLLFGKTSSQEELSEKLSVAIRILQSVIETL